MRNLMLLLISLMSLSLTAQINYYEPDDRLYVCAFSGLNLRMGTSTQSDIIEKLDHGTEVVLLKTTYVQEVYDNREGIWLYVEADGNKGFLFGGFLLSFPPPSLNDSFFDCASNEYLIDWLLNQIPADDLVHTDEKVYKAYDLKEEDWDRALYSQYKSGESFYINSSQNSESYYYESFDLTYNDLINFMDYLVACQNKQCISNSDFEAAKIIPIKDAYGELKKVRCTYPYSLTAEKIGAKMIVQMDICI